MKPIRVENPRWADPEKTAIDADVEWPHLPGQLLPFTASPDDTAAHGRDLYAALLEAGNIGDYVPR